MTPPNREQRRHPQGDGKPRIPSATPTPIRGATTPQAPAPGDEAPGEGETEEPEDPDLAPPDMSTQADTVIDRLGRKNSILEDQLEKLTVSWNAKIEIIKRLKKEKGEWLAAQGDWDAKEANYRTREDQLLNQVEELERLLRDANETILSVRLENERLGELLPRDDPNAVSPPPDYTGNSVYAIPGKTDVETGG